MDRKTYRDIENEIIGDDKVYVNIDHDTEVKLSHLDPDIDQLMDWLEHAGVIGVGYQ